MRRDLVPLSVLIIAMTMGGCVRTVTQARPLGDVFSGDPPAAKLQVRMRDGRKLVMHNPTTVGDSIVFFTGKTNDDRRVRRAEATSNVAMVEISKTNGLSIAGLFGAGIVGLILLAAALVGVIASVLGGG
jgi:hypothetical protein